MVTDALNRKSLNLGGLQQFFLLLLRVTIGWHFLYEGYIKVASEGFNAAGYLAAVPGPFSGMFNTIIQTGWMLSTANFLMSWGLLIAGLCLILGFFSRLAALIIAIMLILFYMSNPPFIGVQSMAGEGHYLIVNKNLIEFAAAMVLAVFPSGIIYGLDLLFEKKR